MIDESIATLSDADSGSEEGSKRVRWEDPQSVREEDVTNETGTIDEDGQAGKSDKVCICVSILILVPIAVPLQIVTAIFCQR